MLHLIHIDGTLPVLEVWYQWIKLRIQLGKGSCLACRSVISTWQSNCWTEGFGQRNKHVFRCEDPPTRQPMWRYINTQGVGGHPSHRFDYVIKFRLSRCCPLSGCVSVIAWNTDWGWHLRAQGCLHSTAPLLTLLEKHRMWKQSQNNITKVCKKK